MRSRAEITAQYANAYVKALKKDKGLIVDQVCSVTSWSGGMYGSYLAKEMPDLLDSLEAHGVLPGR